VRELATLQTIGFRRRSIVLSLIQESVLLSTSASLIAAIVAVLLVHGAPVRFTMGAFALRVDSTVVAVGCGTGLLLGLLGAIPPAIKAMSRSVADALKAV
jgi:ABC-type antimicrobial peptide transport system permease subunit